jgi:hypothetical protein
MAGGELDCRIRGERGRRSIAVPSSPPSVDPRAKTTARKRHHRRTGDLARERPVSREASRGFPRGRWLGLNRQAPTRALACSSASDSPHIATYPHVYLRTSAVGLPDETSRHTALACGISETRPCIAPRSSAVRISLAPSPVKSPHTGDFPLVPSRRSIRTKGQICSHPRHSCLELVWVAALVLSELDQTRPPGGAHPRPGRWAVNGLDRVLREFN